jgi:hypothetical protein
MSLIADASKGKTVESTYLNLNRNQTSHTKILPKFIHVLRPFPL